MPQKINFSDYKASGVYFLEIDNSIITTSSVQTALRLAVGFNMQGPFNRPVYISNTAECDKLFGEIDAKLERRGCFTNRNIRTMVRKAPLFALNLLNVDTAKADNRDTVGSLILSLEPKKDSSTFKSPYAFMYDRTQFWIADDQAFVNNSFVDGSKIIDASVSALDEAAFMGLSNCGTKDISVIVKKSENTGGYNLTFLDYYGSEDKIPYSWINPNDFVSDYIVDVIAISGNWDKAQYSSFADDVVWGEYFTESGLKKDKLAKFLRLDAVNVVGSWTGCILPNFFDQQGRAKSIDYMINKTCNETGLMFAVNQHAMDHVSLDGSTYFFDEDGSGTYNSGDAIAYFKPDFVGHLLTTSDSSIAFTYMSCNVNTKGKVFTATSIADASLESTTMFTLNAANGANVNVGDFVRANSGMMTKIIKKRGTRIDPNDDTSAVIYRFTAADTVLDSSTVKTLEIHKSYNEMYDTLTLYPLTGLKLCNRHMPGFDAAGAPDNEGGVEKIYAMLEDQGIRKGLLNNDSLDFRYIVDTMAFGLKANCGGKRYLSNLATAKKHCTALINAPSMSQFAASDAPFFGADWTQEEGDERPTFDVAYIPEGGNQNLVYPYYTESFTLPDTDNGADHAAVFAPFFKYTQGLRTILVPPAADISNTFMNKFTGGDPYKTVANTNGIIQLSDAFDVEYAFDETDRGYLEPFGINPIINRNGVLMIYGDRTAYQIVNSDMNFLHVRELLNTIQISCQNVLDEYVFTYNTPITRAEITSRLNPILSQMLDSGALLKYEIECDDLNNDKEVIDNKFCIVDIGVWVTQNMEKIVVPITLNRSTTA